MIAGIHILFIILYIVCMTEVASHPNVLLIVSEDMRPELPSYGNFGVVAPNLERLARQSVSFDLAFSQVSVCAPSRASMLTGLRPDSLGIFDFAHFGGLRFFRTIPSHLHSQGYSTAMSGKLFHFESRILWSHFYYGQPSWEEVQKQEMKFHNASVTPDAIHESENSSLPFFRDAHVTENALRFLRKLNTVPQSTSTGTTPNNASDTKKKPWFLAVGYKGPHMQYQMPKRYWDAYANHEFHLTERAPDDAEAPPGYHGDLTYPQGSPLTGHGSSPESRFIMFMKNNGSELGVDREAYQRLGGGRSISVRGWKELYRGYLASLTYMDAQIGKLLDEVDALQLWDDTVVIFTADHGMHFGEKGMWTKWTLFEESTRVPLMIHDPRYPNSYGRRHKEPVELLDIFPTIVDMTGTQLDSSEQCAKVFSDSYALPENGQPVTRKPLEQRVVKHRYCDALDGTSLAPIIRALNTRGTADQADLDPDLDVEGKRQHFRPFPFAMTQKLTCKSPGILKTVKRTRPSSASVGYFDNNVTDVRAIDYRMIDAWSGSWTEHCPFRRLSGEDRWPNYGAMGYSIRAVDWTYTAWVLVDVDTLLPALDIAPLAEELYDHRPRVVSRAGRDKGRSSSGKNPRDHISASASASASAPANSLLVRSVSGDRQLVNLVNQNQTDLAVQSAHHKLRKALYDFLFFNNSYSHYFQTRSMQHADLLAVVNEAEGESKHVALKRKHSQKERYADLVYNRANGSPHPHWARMRGHFYSSR